MKPIPFPAVNCKLIAPGCFDVPAHRDAEGYVTVWTFTDEERAAVAAGADLSFAIAGHMWPPVGMGIIGPDNKIIGQDIREG